MPLDSTPPAVARLRTAWNAREGSAREQAVFGLLLAAVVAGAHLARIGTGLARGATFALIGLAILGQVLVFVRRRRENASIALTVNRILRATDPVLSVTASRALKLVERTERDPSVGEPELARAHFSRLLDRVTSDAVRDASSRVAERLRALTVVLVSLAAVVTVVGPAHVAEGLDVLAARHGRAPLPMKWLSFPRITAQPPAYTRETERSLALGTSVALPKGTVVLVRGIPLSKGRELCVTDGTHEEPFASDGAGGVVSRWVVATDASLRVAARFGDVRIDDEESVEVSAIADAPPLVRVDGAPKTVELTKMDRLSIQWTAEDDHGLREVDLVLRSGAREDRRVLSRFDGESKVEHGGRVVSARDPFLRRTFVPVTVVVEAKDNDPISGPKWSRSEPITVVPPEVGEPEAIRLAALRTVRDDLVDLLALRMQAADDPKARAAADSAALAALSDGVKERLAATYSGLGVPPGVVAFFDGQMDRLTHGPGGKNAKGAEEALLAVDAAISAVGARDSQDVAKRLGEVAEEAAASARAAREKEGNSEALARLDASLSAIEHGAVHLQELGALGQDVGSVASGDAGRIRHARTEKDFYHAELAALHLAERLRRPVPSFGATTGGGGHGGGVESGHGRGGGGLPSPSQANEEWKRKQDAVSELSEEHQGALRGVEGALDEASRKEPTDAERNDAKRIADAVRRAVDPLPLPGQEFGTPRASAALAREHAQAAAHALDDLALSEAEESARSGLAALEEAERSLDPDDPLRQEFGAAKKALAEARDFARAAAEKRRAEAEAHAGKALEQAGDTEQGLAERAEKLAEDGAAKEVSLPRDVKDRLERAANVMRQAARELAEGHGQRGAELQREAQRLLEQAKPEHRGETRSPDDDADERGEPDDATKDSEQTGERGSIATGGNVPKAGAGPSAEEFRKRVLEGLSNSGSERLSPALKRYAEGLLR